MPVDPERRALQVVAYAMLAGSVGLLVIAAALRRESLAAPPLLAYVAAGVAALSPLAAAVVRQRVRGDGALPPTPDQLRTLVVATFGILEGAAVLCAVALLFGGPLWLLGAAAVPVVAMLMLVPRGD